ncbi:M20 family metallo-hydrolase [Vibrio penaeicida]|uniref:Zn-dependent hydrolase n=1 Tax=Vibrio penaeicida TaxID=104609 RepID=A0AAV5NNM4_9VIBR|nr:M20 family metallo-hydrolase [Vibrio penaeicida]RTZ23643.1 Zn-dependent hydrolase [Vibrio penaeicida]GLQ72003.1 Zn-dependent hydrolase [Vibrio penaeicida]
MKNYGAIAQDWLSQLAQFSETQEGVTRRPFTVEHRKTLDQLTIWMEQAGLEVRLDNAGTLIGRYNSPVSSKTLLFGSHQDSIRKGGKYDGIMGIVLPIIALKDIIDQGVELPFSVEILAFADEEGVRFPTALIGPRALAGTLDTSVMKLKDADGISIQEAMAQFGLSSDDLGSLIRNPQELLGYLEVHIEQGPILEANDLALGVVSAICGIERHEVQFVGESAHAGTCPMELRKDALSAAALLIAEVEAYARSTPELKATVGRLNVEPNVVNAIPSHAAFSIEIRSPNDNVRLAAGAHFHQYAEKLAEERGLDASASKTYEQIAQPCSPVLQSKLQSALSNVGQPDFVLPSGATHDASAMADLTPMGMLFVRSENGLSHNPAEFTTSEDMNLAIEALIELLTNWKN